MAPHRPTHPQPPRGSPAPNNECTGRRQQRGAFGFLKSVSFSLRARRHRASPGGGELLRDSPGAAPSLRPPVVFACREQIQQPAVCGPGLCQSCPTGASSPSISLCQLLGKISARQAGVLAAFPAPLPKDPRCLHQPSLSLLMCCFISSLQALCNSLQLGRPILLRLNQSVPDFDQKHYWHLPPPWLPILRICSSFCLLKSS